VIVRQKLAFQDPGSRQTLGEGLAEFRASLPEQDQQNTAMTRDLFLHDVCHVVFGQGTSVDDDVVVDVWIVFGTDVHTRSYLAALFRSHALQALIERDGLAGVARGLIRAVPRACFSFFRARRMTCRWPWAGADRYLDTPLFEIRSEYGIRLA